MGGIESMRNLVFISYASEKGASRKSDRQVADMIYDALKSRGISCWVAHRDIAPGLNWPDEISKAISKSGIMVLVVSANTQNSRYVSMEVTQAADENIIIIPFFIEEVLLRGGLKLLLGNCQWFDAYPQPQKKHFDQLVEAVLGYQPKTPEKPPALDVKKQPEVLKEVIKKKEKKTESLLKKPIVIAVSVIILLIAGVLLINKMVNKKETPTGKDTTEKISTVENEPDPGRGEVQKSIAEEQKEISKGTPAIKTTETTADNRKNKKEIKEKSKESQEKPDFIKYVESKGAEVKPLGKDSWEAYYKEYDLTMIYIPPGKFIMGSDDGGNDEKPPHEVDLDGYWIGKYEVTFEQYDRYCEDTKKGKPDDRGWGRGKRPVINISWHDAKAYCDWLSRKTGLKFKLPTEARWEKAARGEKERKYPWGKPEPSGKMANFADNQLWLKEKYDWADKDIDDGYIYTAPVGSYPQGASPYGLLDMAGNVWEWCHDRYDADYYEKIVRENKIIKNPTGPESGTDRVVRGGGWFSFARYLRCAYRSNYAPSNRDGDLGFRLCQDI